MDPNPLNTQKQFMTKLIYLTSKLHSCGIIYGDNFFTNIIVNDNDETYLD